VADRVGIEPTLRGLRGRRWATQPSVREDAGGYDPLADGLKSRSLSIRV
jgi:hypothetical protein